MARVPVYGGPQIAEQPQRPAYIDAGAATAGSRQVAQLGQALSGAGDLLDRAALRDDTAAAFDVETKMTAEWLRTDTALRKHHRGDQADGYLGEVEKWWAEAPQRYGEALNPRARALAGRTMQSRQVNAISSASQYYEAEKERAALEGFQAARIMGVQNALADGRPEAVAAERDLIIERNAREAARTGRDTKWAEAENLRDLSSLHVGMLAKLMDRKTSDAKAYYIANKGEIDAGRHAAIEDQLDKVGRIERSQEAADAVMAAGVPLDAAMRHIEKEYSGEDENAIKAEVVKRYQINEAAQLDAKRAALGKAQLEYEQTGRVKPSTLSMLDDGQKADILRQQKADAKARLAAAGGEKVKTDWTVYTDLRQRIASGEKIDLRTYVGSIAPGQMEQLIDASTSTTKGGPKQDSFMTDEQRLNTALVEMGIDKKKDPDVAGRIMSEADRRVRALSAAKGGKEVMPDEKEKILADIAMDVVYLDEWGSDPQKPLATLAPDDLTNAYVRVDGRNVKLSAIPPADRQQIVAALRATGQSVTEQAIATLYARGKAAKPAAKAAK